VVAPSDPQKDETCSDVLKHVTEVQVWAFEEHRKEIHQNVGKVVEIAGTLDEDPAPGAHIDVQITPTSIDVK
jgi:hypothetical protein